MTALKEAAHRAINSLPDSAELDDIIEEIIYYAKIEEGIRDADAGRVTPIEEVMAEYGVRYEGRPDS